MFGFFKRAAEPETNFAVADRETPSPEPQIDSLPLADKVMPLTDYFCDTAKAVSNPSDEYTAAENASKKLSVQRRILNEAETMSIFSRMRTADDEGPKAGLSVEDALIKVCDRYRYEFKLPRTNVMASKGDYERLRADAHPLKL